MFWGKEKFNIKAEILYIFFVHMDTCWWNSPDTCDPKTVIKYFNGPYLGYLWSELDENNFLLPKVNTDYIYVQHNIN